MIQDLIDNDCIKLGDFILKNNERSSYYIDIKYIISTPSLLRNIGDELYKLLGDFDIICGIPYGGLPIATYISIRYNKPLIYIRDKAKTYGTKNHIEGKYSKNNRCVIIDDVLTSGGSVKEAYNVLKDKVNIVNIGVVFNRSDCLNKISTMLNVPINSVFCKNDITTFLNSNKN